MRKFFIEIEKRVKTKRDLLFYLEKIDITIELMSKNIEGDSFEKFKNEIGEGLSNILLKIEEEKKIKDPEQQIFFLELLRDHLISLPQIRLEVAFYPNERTVSKISEWIEKETGKKILEFKVNPTIIGGAIIEYRGRRVDFSLLKKIKSTEITTF